MIKRYLLCLLLGIASLASWPAASQEQDALAPLAIGAAMEDFGLRALDTASGQLKQLVWLSDYVGPQVPRENRKRLLVLSYFAMWCKPCLSELTLLRDLQSRYAVNGLQVLGVNHRRADESLADTVQTLQRWLPEGGLGFPLLFDRYTDRTQLVYLGRPAKLPHSVLIDGTGHVVARMQGSEARAIERAVRAQLGLSDSTGASP
jgi:thiol-disulfide isomerase/thioredoxin